jgi:hypothetical protein
VGVNSIDATTTSLLLLLLFLAAGGGLGDGQVCAAGERGGVCAGGCRELVMGVLD